MSRFCSLVDVSIPVGPSERLEVSEEWMDWERKQTVVIRAVHLFEPWIIDTELQVLSNEFRKKNAFPYKC